MANAFFLHPSFEVSLRVRYLGQDHAGFAHITLKRRFVQIRFQSLTDFIFAGEDRFFQAAESIHTEMIVFCRAALKELALCGETFCR